MVIVWLYKRPYVTYAYEVNTSIGMYLICNLYVVCVKGQYVNCILHSRTYVRYAYEVNTSIEIYLYAISVVCIRGQYLNYDVFDKQFVAYG